MKLKTPLVIVLLCISALVGRAEITHEKRAEIDRMLKLTGMESLCNQMIGQLTAGLRNQMKEVPPEFWDRFAKKISGSELLEKIVPLYDKYYSLEDLRAVNEFYSSPAGQRVLSTLPQIMQESMKVGQEWGAKVGQQAAEEAMAEIKLNKQKQAEETAAESKLKSEIAPAK